MIPRPDRDEWNPKRLSVLDFGPVRGTPGRIEGSGTRTRVAGGFGTGAGPAREKKRAKGAKTCWIQELWLRI